MNQPLSEALKPATSQSDLAMWRILKKALRSSLADRGIDVGDDEASIMTRLMFEKIERSGLRVVPLKPISAMHLAMKQALDQGKRMTVSWVGLRAKQRWRYEAAIDAAPRWQRGYEQDRKDDDDAQ